MYDGICIVSFTLNEPVNSCISNDWSPNLLEPDENITDEEIYVVFNSVAVIVPTTFKLCREVTPPTFKFPAI